MPRLLRLSRLSRLSLAARLFILLALALALALAAGAAATGAALYELRAVSPAYHCVLTTDVAAQRDARVMPVTFKKQVQWWAPSSGG